MSNKERAPFLEELQKYVQKKNTIFHTPGHRGGASLGELWGHSDFLQLDLTELTGLNWNEARKDAEQLAADFYKADRSFFLVQGASQGILTALLGCFDPGDKILVARNCHISVFHGLVLANLIPIFIEVDFLPGWGIPVGINHRAFKAAIIGHPEAKGVILTNPTYQGIGSRITAYRELIGDRILIVDEAHGGHFDWWGATGYDAHAVADVWVQGTHKFMGSLTQTAMLHIRKRRVDPEVIEQRLGLLTTTSPSFPFLASLDANRAFLESRGQRLFVQELANIQKFKKNVSDLPGLNVLTEDLLPDSDKRVDPWRMSISGLEFGLTGFEFDKILRENYAAQSEYADYNQVTFLLPPWQIKTDLSKLLRALAEIVDKYHINALEPLEYILPVPLLKVKPSEAVFSKVGTIPIDEADGKIAAAVVAPYPPGIPLVGPGEQITRQSIALLKEIIKAGGIVNGLNQKQQILISYIEANAEDE